MMYVVCPGGACIDMEGGCVTNGNGFHKRRGLEIICEGGCGV